MADELVEEDVLLTPLNRTDVLLESFSGSSTQIIDGLLEELGNALLEEEGVSSAVFIMIVGLLVEYLPLTFFNMTGVLLEEEVDLALLGESNRTDVLLEEEDVPPTLVNGISGLLEEAGLLFVSLNMTGVLFKEEADLDEMLDGVLEELDRTYLPLEGADVLRLPLNELLNEGLGETTNSLFEEADGSSILLGVDVSLGETTN